jgi:hypothetical protein
MLVWAELQAYVDEVRQECWSHWVGPVVAVTEEPADEQDEQWERLRRSLPRTDTAKKFQIAEIIAAYEEATGTCIGCD